MFLVSTPLGSLAIAALALIGLVSWLTRSRRHPGPRPVGRHRPIDRMVLDAAEAEVRGGTGRPARPEGDGSEG